MPESSGTPKRKIMRNKKTGLSLRWRSFFRVKIGNGGNYEADKRNGNRGCVPDAAWFWNLHGTGTYLMYRDGEEEYDTLREYVAVES